MNGPPGAHRAALAQAGVPPDAVTSLAAFLDLLAEWSSRVNLTGARTPEERVAQLVTPVLPALPLVRGPRLLDVGSGNGSPGLVLGLLQPDLDVTLLEPRTRRWAFLREAARSLGLSGRVRAERLRHDQCAAAPFDTVTVRALAVTATELDGLVAPGGRILVWRVEPAAPGFEVCGRWATGTALCRAGRST